MKPLDDISVLELTSWIAAPSAGAILADLGATVTKVEPIGGDTMRGLMRPAKGETADVDHGFQIANRGKRSIAVAIDTEDGADVVRRLAAETDVLLTNLLPHRQARYGLDADTIGALNPRIVHATLTGYGVTGPEVARPGYDVTAFFGRGGITDYATDPGMDAPRAGPGQGDLTTGLAMTSTILAALRMVERTGESQSVDVSLFETAVWTMACEVAPTLVDRKQPTRRGRRNLISPLANRFPCGDGRWIVLNMPELHWWPKFCNAMAHPEWIDDARFDSVKTRFENMGELIDLIDGAFATATMAEWGERFDAAGLIWGPVQNVVELVDDPQARAVGLFPSLPHPTGAFDTVASPLNLHGVDTDPTSPAPTVGEHTRAVLIDAGLSESEIDALVADGSVA